MNEKEAIQILKNMNIEISGTSTCKECIYDDETHCFRDGKDCQMQAIETVLNLLEKKDKMIDEMAEKIFEEGIVWENKEDVKQYFERKIE